MAAWGSNIGEAIRESVPDQGFPETIDLFNILRGHTGLLLTLSTTPKNVLTSDYLTAQWDASSSVAAYVKTMLLPTLAFQASKKVTGSGTPDLTYNIPFLRFRLHARVRMAGATDVPVITVTAKLRASGGAIKTLFTPTSIAADGSTLTDGTCKALGNPTNPDLRTWDFFQTYGTGPVYAAPGDYLDIKMVPGAHTTDALELHGLTMGWNVNPNYTDITARS